MADIRCPNCGKNNPDWLDVCQFCQTPLKPESVLHIGEKPTKKNTGELESVLPDWLKDMRQQAKDAAQEEAAQAAAKRPQKEEEPPDLLAGAPDNQYNASFPRGSRVAVRRKCANAGNIRSDSSTALGINDGSSSSSWRCSGCSISARMALQ